MAKKYVNKICVLEVNVLGNVRPFKSAVVKMEPVEPEFVLVALNEELRVP